MAFVATHLDPRRFRSIVCTFANETSILEEQLKAGGIPIHHIACRDGIDGMAPFRLAKLMHSFGCDVVQCYNPRPILYGGLAAKLAGVRGTVGFLSAFACQMPDQTYRFLPQPLTTTSRRNIYRNRIAARLMRYLVTVSAPLGKRFCEYNGLAPDKLRIIPYGADLSAVERVTVQEANDFRLELGYHADEILVGSVGRLVEQKDYPTQLRAFAKAVAEVPRLRMVLAGAGPLKADLLRMARELKISGQVSFIGHCERVPAFLRCLDIFVLASRFEPFGVALLEAKAAGVAIVATRVNEIPEIVSDGESGLLSPAEDPESMSRLFVLLARNREMRATLGKQASAEARARNSLESVVRGYQELYHASLA
ncbi:MAG: glycosyltransferase [Acidobacteriia bacterium]|nr:glycosyltransferase [Terriglobia bacterium]